jgi:hypothetical protein
MRTISPSQNTRESARFLVKEEAIRFMTEKVAFLMKDLVLFAASFYLLKQDVARVALSREVFAEFQKRPYLKMSHGRA